VLTFSIKGLPCGAKHHFLREEGGTNGDLSERPFRPTGLPADSGGAPAMLSRWLKNIEPLGRILRLWPTFGRIWSSFLVFPVEPWPHRPYPPPARHCCQQLGNKTVLHKINNNDWATNIRHRNLLCLKLWKHDKWQTQTKNKQNKFDPQNYNVPLAPN